MPFSHGTPMPHSPGCLGGSHRNAGDRPCEEFRKETNRRARDRFPVGDCEWCTREGVALVGCKGKTMCRTCRNRWLRRGYEGQGPGPGFCPLTERASECAEVIQRLSLSRAAEQLGVTPRTISRWRAVLKEAA